jgi:hypothetical protein
MTAVRPGETVDARFTEIGDEKNLLSLRVMSVTPLSLKDILGDG